MAKLDLSKYGITGTTEIVYNPSYEQLFNEETKPELEGYEKGQVSELGAVNVMTGIYTVLPPNNGQIYYQLISMTHLIKIMYLSLYVNPDRKSTRLNSSHRT